MDPLIEKLQVQDPRILENVKEDTTLGMYSKAKFQESWELNPAQSLINLTILQDAADEPQDIYDDFGLVETVPGGTRFPRLDREAWKESPYYHPALSFEEMASEDGKVSTMKAELLKQWKDEEWQRREIIERGPSGFTPKALGFVSQIAASVVDPLNMASAFIPIVPAGAWAVRLGRTWSLLARGAIEGAVGNAMVEPAVIAAAHSGQMDYTFYDSVTTVLFGAALGAGLHTGLGKLSDSLEIRSLRDQESRMKAAWKMAEDGYPIDLISFVAASKMDADIAPHIRELPNLENAADPVARQAIIDDWYKRNSVDDGDLVAPALWGEKADSFIGKLPFEGADRTTVSKLLKGRAVSTAELTSLKKAMAPLFDAAPKAISEADVIDTIKLMAQDYLLSFRSQKMKEFTIAEDMRALGKDIADNLKSNPGSSALTPELKTDLGTTRKETVDFIKKEVQNLKDRIGSSKLARKDEVVKNISAAEYKMQLSRERRAPLIQAILDEFSDVNPGTVFSKKRIEDISPELRHKLGVELGGTEEARNFMLWVLHEYNNADRWVPQPGDKTPTVELPPAILTPDHKNQLLKLGYGPEDINKMTPEEGMGIVFRGWKKGTPEPPMPDPFAGAQGTPVHIATLYDNINNSMDFAEYVNLRAMAHSQARVAALLEHIDKSMAWAEKYKPGDAKYKVNVLKEAIDSYLWGTGTRLPGARASMDALSNALMAKFQGGLLNELEKAGTLKKLMDSSGEFLEFNRDVARAMWEIDRAGGDLSRFSKEVVDTANAIHRYQELAVDRLIKAGAVITKLPGYIVKQIHNREKIAAVGYDTWKAEILPKLDAANTFRGDNPDEFLRSVYDNIVSGKWTVFDNESDVSIRDNLGARVSATRRLFFNSADNWYDYNMKFGNSPYLLPAVQHGLDRAAKNAAVMEYLGPTPKAVLNSVVKYAKEDFSDNPKALKMLEKRSNEWDSAIDESLGLTSIPANIDVAKWGGGARAIQNMAKLGSAVLSAITDVPFFAAEMRYQGNSLLHSYFNAMTNVFRGRRGGQQKELAEILGVGLDGMRGSVLARFTGGDDYLTGKLAWANNTFFKLSGLNYWTDAQKTGFGLMVSHYLARNADKEFGDLNKGLRRTLELYNISPDEWNIMRSKGLFTADDGTKYLMPDVLRKSEVAEEIEDKLRMYIIDSADRGVPTPGLRERMMLKGGILGGGVAQAGTVWGEAVRMFSQFKSFPLTVTRKILGRELFGIEGGANKLTSLGHLLIATTVLGYASMSMKDLTKGKQLKDPLRYDAWTASFLQGGGLGIMSDFLFSTQSRYGQSALETFMGPSYSTMVDFYHVYAATRNVVDDGIDPEKDAKVGTAYNAAVSALKNNMPFINLYYARGLVDFAILKNLQEELSPGYTSRVENQMMREYGQEFWMAPQGGISLPKFYPSKISENVTK